MLNCDHHAMQDVVNFPHNVLREHMSMRKAGDVHWEERGGRGTDDRHQKFEAIPSPNGSRQSTDYRYR